MMAKAVQAGNEFMRFKGYGSIDPVVVEAGDEEMTWYLMYELDEGDLELEVKWDGAEWFWEVVDFVHLRDMPKTPAS